MIPRLDKAAVAARQSVLGAHPFTLEREAAKDKCPPRLRLLHRPSLQVGFVLWPDFTMLALAGFIDALRLAADIGDRSEQIHCS